jgi:hypothetical protein
VILKNACPLLGVLPWQTAPGETIPKLKLVLLGSSPANVIGTVVHVIATADSHSVQNIVEFHSQLSLNSLTQEESLGKSQSFVALERVSKAGIKWSGIAYPPSPGKLKLLDVEYRQTLVVIVPVHIERARHNIGAVVGAEMPPKRKLGDSEHYLISMFEALAIAVQYEATAIRSNTGSPVSTRKEIRKPVPS